MKKFSQNVFVLFSVITAMAGVTHASDVKCGDSIISDGMWLGKVVDVYQNGDALIQTNYQTSPYVVGVDHLSKETSCINKLCEGDSIISDDMWIGSVSKLFENGDAEIKTNFQTSPYLLEASHLSKEARCASGICQGDDILSDGEWNGTVLRVYTDGATEIQTNFQTSPYIIDASHLSKSTCQGATCSH